MDRAQATGGYVTEGETAWEVLLPAGFVTSTNGDKFAGLSAPWTFNVLPATCHFTEM